MRAFWDAFKMQSERVAQRLLLRLRQASARGVRVHGRPQPPRRDVRVPEAELAIVWVPHSVRVPVMRLVRDAPLRDRALVGHREHEDQE